MRCIFAILVGALVVGAAPAAKAQTYRLATSWAVVGDGGIAVDAAGNVYVAAGTQVSKFDPTGAPIGGWSTASEIRRIAIDGDGFVYLLAGNLDLLEFDASGGPVNAWSGLADVERGLAVDAGRNVYLFVFAEGWQIRRVSPAGQTLNVFGSYFEIPQAIAVGPDGSVYGTDGEPNYPAVQRYEPVGGTRLAAWGDGFAPREGGESGDGEFHTPYAIDVAGGKVFVVDGGNSRVQVFDETGNFLTKWSSSANRGVAADASGNVYLYGGGRVEKWEASSNTPVRAAT